MNLSSGKTITAGYGKAALVLIFSWLSLYAQAQSKKDIPVFDTSYYKIYPKYITARAFFSKKYTGFSMDGPDAQRTLRYSPNTPVSLGVGATYGAVTLNLGAGLNFLNPNRKDKGKTKSLDLQSHIYTRKLAIDLYGQFYKGYFLSPKGIGVTNGEDYYLRRDVKVNLLGASVYKLLNFDRFSYRAAFLQNEWQKKSAGTFLIGAEIYIGLIKGDSSLVPGTLASAYNQYGVVKTRFIEIGAGVGYAYTAVYKQHFFVTGSVAVNGDIGFVKENTATGNENNTTFSPNVTVRAVAGYNSDTWSATASWVNNTIALNGNYADADYRLRTGNLRLTFAKRFKPGRKLKKKLEIIDDLPLPKN